MQAFTIVGAGRVGLALADMGTGQDVCSTAPRPALCTNHPQVLVRRGEPIDGPPGPIIVATRNDALQSVVDATPLARHRGRSSIPPKLKCLFRKTQK